MPSCYPGDHFLHCVPSRRRWIEPATGAAGQFPPCRKTHHLGRPREYRSLLRDLSAAGSMCVDSGSRRRPPRQTAAVGHIQTLPSDKEPLHQPISQCGHTPCILRRYDATVERFIRHIRLHESDSAGEKTADGSDLFHSFLTIVPAQILNQLYETKQFVPPRIGYGAIRQIARLPESQMIAIPSRVFGEGALISVPAEYVDNVRMVLIHGDCHALMVEIICAAT